MPVLPGILLIALVLAVVFVNGWTDAPNAIASAVATKALRYKDAVGMAAICNLLGLVVMSFANASVADTVTGMVNLSGVPTTHAMAALCGAMLSIVAFALCAWYFGIPTSESHALLAALAGASLALGGSGVNRQAWNKVLLGLIMSLALGFLFGNILAKTLGRLLLRARGRLLDYLQTVSAGGMAFMHGAQDGQKFVAVFVMADLLAKGFYRQEPMRMLEHIPVLLLVGVVMAAGTGVGGKRIIQSVGVEMVPLEKYQGVCADLGSSLCLLLASLSGIPMSTTHTKTTAIMGAGVAGNPEAVNVEIIRGMITAWVVTFPACGILGYFSTRLLVWLFV